MNIINKQSIIILKYLFAALLIVVGFTYTVAAQSKPESISLTEEERSWISEHPVLKATNEMDWAPIDFVRSGEPAGFSIDYLNLVARKVGLNIEYVNGHTWEELVKLLKNKEIDIAHSLALNSERKEYLNFTDAYITLPMVYYGRHGSSPLRTIEDLKDLKIGAIKSWTSTDAYRENYPNLIVIEYKTLQSALEGLAKGEIDAFATLFQQAQYTITKNFISGLEVIGDGFLEGIDGNDKLHLAARNDEPLLHSILTKAMNMVTEEEYIALSKKWLMESNTINEVNLTSDEKQWLIENNIIKVAVDPTLVPIDMIGENGEIQGISGAYLNKIATILNVKFEWAGSENWSEAVEMIASGDAQIYSAINPTAEREKTLIFTEQTVSTTNMIFGRRQGNQYSSLESLSGYKIAQMKGFSITEKIKSDYPDIETIEVSTSVEALNLLAAGRVDAHISNIPVATYHLEKEGLTNIQVIGETQYKDINVIGIPKTFPLLASSIQKAMETLSQEDKRKISREWIVLDTGEKVNYDVIKKAVLGAFVVFIIIFIWGMSLKGEIKRRIKIEENLKIEQAKTLEALEKNNQQMVDLQFQRETIEQSAEVQASLMDDVALMSADIEVKNRLLTEVMNNTGHGIVVFSPELRLQAWNDTFKEIMGLQDREYEENMDLKSFFELNMSGEDTYDLSIDDYISELKERIKNRLDCEEYSWEREKPNGSVIKTVQRIMGDCTVINTYEDITLERQEQLKIKEMALTDGLTGLANRRSFDVNMEEAIRQYKQSNRPFLLAYMDLDNFKNLNDTQGHKAGDLVLVHVADVMKKHIRANDVPARLGGDEFAIIFQNSDDTEAAENSLEAIIQEIKNTNTLDGYEVDVGASAGLSQCLDSDISASEMVEVADKALYMAKENGKGQVFKSLSA